MRDARSDLRRVSTWPIERTFVYLDISDFSETPPGQQLLVINALVRMLNQTRHWPGLIDSVRHGMEARLCIGDGYIYVFDPAHVAVYFAAHFAWLIETLAARKWLPVEFHFRIGIHCGQVYTFWDEGRNGWNYVGEGINGGQRILAAAGKEYDDTVYLSGEVRHALMGMNPESLFGHRQLLHHLHNRGRRLDKHGRAWRVYEVNHSAVCASDLHSGWPKPLLSGGY